MRNVPKKCISIAEASEMTGIAKKTISNMVYKGKLTRYGIKGKVTLDVKEVTQKLILGCVASGLFGG